MAALVRREPARCGVARARWRVADLQAALPCLAGYHPASVGRLLRRLGLRLKRGRLRVHSPDPGYDAKAFRLRAVLGLARRHPDRVGLWFGDEASVHRQPTLAGRWHPAGSEPTAGLSHRADTRLRVAAGLEAATGRVLHASGSKAGVARLVAFLGALRAADPDRVVFLAWDNWPVHKHPHVLAAAAAHRIHLLWLPTYAPWLNPIEKLWRWCKQEVTHHHRLADRWDELKAAVLAFLDRFADGSDDLLRYVGLGTD